MHPTTYLLAYYLPNTIDASVFAENFSMLKHSEIKCIKSIVNYATFIFFYFKLKKIPY